MAETKTIEFVSALDGGSYSVRATVVDNYDIVTNVSTLTVTKIEAKTSVYNGIGATVDGTVLINGQAAALFNDTANWGTIRNDYSYAATPQSSTPVDVLHNNDGTLSVSVSLGKNGSGYTAFTIVIQSGGYKNKKQTAEAQTLALTTQPRASTIASITQNVSTQSAIALAMNRKADSATHIATITSGGRTLYTSGSFGASISIAAARTWFANFPTVTQLTATVSVQTYMSGTAVGSPVTASITINADEGMKPTVSSGWFSAARVNTSAAAGIAAYIKGYSQARFTFDSSKITMASGASIALYSVSYAAGTKTGSGTITTDILNAAGTITFTVRVIDSRGRYAEATASVTVNDYSPPTLGSISVYRANASGTASDSGTYIALRATAGISSISGLNSYTLKASYRAQSGSYGTETTMTSGSLTVLGGGQIATNTSYTARIRLTDALGNTASFEQTVSTAEVAFNIRAGGHGAAFGKFAEADKELQLPADWQIKIGNEYLQSPRYIGNAACHVNGAAAQFKLGTYDHITPYDGTQNWLRNDGGVPVLVQPGVYMVVLCSRWADHADDSCMTAIGVVPSPSDTTTNGFGVWSVNRTRLVANFTCVFDISTPTPIYVYYYSDHGVAMSNCIVNFIKIG